MNEDGRLKPGQHEIWASRQILSMQPESVPRRVKRSAYLHLGVGVSTPNASHHSTASFTIDHIHQLPSASQTMRAI